MEKFPAEMTAVPSVNDAAETRETAVIVEATASEPALEIVPLVIEPMVDRFPPVSSA